MPTQADSSASLPWWCIVLIGRRPKRTLVRIGVLVAVCFVLFRFVLAPVRIQGPSMLPTCRRGQVRMVNRLPIDSMNRGAEILWPLNSPTQARA